MLLYSNARDEHLDIIRKLFDHLRGAKLAIYPTKREFCNLRVTLKGYDVGHDQVRPIDDKIRCIAQWLVSMENSDPISPQLQNLWPIG